MKEAASPRFGWQTVHISSQHSRSLHLLLEAENLHLGMRFFRMGCGSSSLKGTSPTEDLASQPVVVNQIGESTQRNTDGQDDKSNSEPKRKQQLDQDVSSRQALIDYYNPKKKGSKNTPYNPSTGSNRVLPGDFGANV